MQGFAQEVLLNRYRILEEVGQGGMASVYRGIDLVLEREVAVKILHPHLASKAEAKKRFRREAQAIAKLKHINILEVYDFSSEESDLNFIIMEFVRGRSLKDFFDENEVSVPEVAAMIVHEIAGALVHAHSAGIVHRDVKPENIMVRQDGVLKLMDFGIAHFLDLEHLTVTGTIVGSPAHMSPEHIEGKNIDHRADIFSLGTMFYLFATGMYPFTGSTPHALLRNILEGKYENPRTYRQTISDEMCGVIRKMMSRDVRERYQSAHAVREEIAGYLSSFGVLNIGKELRCFFTNPCSYQEEFKQKLIEYHLKRGGECLKLKDIAGAMRNLDRVLSFEPENIHAREHLSQIEKSVKLRDYLKKVGTALIITSLATAIVFLTYNTYNYFITKEDSGSVENFVERTVVAQRQAGAANSDLIRFQERRPAAMFKIQKKVDQGVQTKRQVKEMSVLVPVRIFAHPPAVKILVNGVEKGFGTTGEIRLSEGFHDVTLIHPTCDVCVETKYRLKIDSKNHPKEPIRYAITYRDATLMVKSDTQARVTVNGIYRGETNTPLRVQMTTPEETTCSVTVTAADFPPKNLTVKLKPGASVVQEVNFR